MATHPSCLDALDTPTVLIDEAVAEANLARAQAELDRLGIALRPHIKTHKLVHWARVQETLGAKGLTCQKLGEAEVFVDAGFDDILVTYNILGAAKLARLRALAARARMTVVSDGPEVADALSDAFADSPTPLPVLVECDIGAKRCGVQSPEAAAALAARIDKAPGLVFEGLMTYPAPGTYGAVEAFLASAIAACAAHGLACPTVSVGGTPSLRDAALLRSATEYRPGTYIYNDRMQIAHGACTLEDCALTVLATVVSRPTADRAVVDAGSKSLSADRAAGADGYGLVLDYPEAVVTGLSEEHGVIDLSACAARPSVGERVRIVPNHACPVSNLTDEVVLWRGDRTTALKVDARGRVQ